MRSRSQGYPRNSRLLTPRDFRHVFAAPAKSADRFFVVLARANGDRPARLGVAIAKRQLRLAVQRNRVKRVVRENFRHTQSLLHGLDIVVMARPGLAQRSNRELSDSLQRHWRRLSRPAGA